MIINANQIHASYDENNVLIVAFAESSTGDKPQRYFMIQHSLQYDEQDAALGQDTYYLEKNDESMCCYGGVQRVFFSRKEIVFEFNKSVRNRLKVKFIKIILDETIAHEELKRKLQIIFTNGEIEISD